MVTAEGRREGNERPSSEEFREMPSDREFHWLCLHVSS